MGNEFYELVITDLKEQLALLSDQKAVQVALNIMKQNEITKLQERIKELEGNKKGENKE
ncbi:hypothetical protein [Heyndrickxia acidicola]|uniref:Uncharacterized protein n=1 Tax=Heyndrickxia acidicola TaxID=209389 RepID=A0ABU6MN76_9BACI|nr:hypothetical protein [Heyndrickxia acidicola]MED1205852.1 hypothetical protein [Heyndrickxia acidicola]